MEYVTDADPATRKEYTNVRVFRPKWPLLYNLFKNQAGSMTLLADEAVTVLMTTITFADVTAAQRRTGYVARPTFHTQGVSVMHDIVVQRILNTALSQSDSYLAELAAVEAELDV